MIKKKKTDKKQPLQRRARETKKAILQASAQILSRDGLDALNTNRVARTAGVSVGSLYQYFTDKDEIVKDLTLEHFDSRNQAILAMLLSGDLDALSTHEAIKKILKAVFQVPSSQHPLDQELVRKAVQNTSPERLREQDAILIPALRGFLQMKGEFAEKKNLDLTLYVIIHSLRGLLAANVMVPPNENNSDALVEEASQMIVRYLAGQK